MEVSESRLQLCHLAGKIMSALTLLRPGLISPAMQASLMPIAAVKRRRHRRRRATARARRRA
jgi:hypothetical protein